jgi:hypothetical protein
MKMALRIASRAAVLAAIAAVSSFNRAKGNHYILPCTPDCREPVDISIGPGMTGTWFEPTQSGHGLAIEVLPGEPPQLMAAWFVFDPQGGQTWIVARGPVSGTRAVLQGYRMEGAGGRFPPEFDAKDVHAVAWGSLTLTFSDCSHGRMTWTSTTPGYGSGSLDLERLTMPAGLSCQTKGVTGPPK